MKFNTINEKERIILSEIEKFFELSDKNIEIDLIQNEEKTKVVATKEKIEVYYQKANQLARALFLITAKHTEGILDFEIDESCIFNKFGTMLDCSRNAVVKVSELKKFVVRIALLGFNELNLYMEDTFEVEEYPYFGYMRGAYSTEEIKEIQDYCDMFDMNLVPCIQMLAHFDGIVQYECFAELFDINNIMLVGEEKTYEFLDKLLKSISEKFSSKIINIGMDEAHMLGMGKYRAKHGTVDSRKIMVEHLSHVTKLLEKYGFTARMWSDMFFKYLPQDATKEMIQSIEIPKEIQLVYWDYYSLEKSHYQEQFKRHTWVSDNIGFAAGAWKWCGFVPHNDFAIRCANASFEASEEYKIKDYLLTTWGDNGAESSIYSILPTIYTVSCLAYSREKNDAEFKLLTGYTFEEYMQIDSVNYINSPDRDTVCNSSKFLFYNDILLGTFDSEVIEGAEYGECINTLNELSKRESDFSYIFKNTAVLTEFLSKKTEMGIKLKKAYDNKDKAKLKDLSQDLSFAYDKLIEFTVCFEEQWMTENKPFGFEVQNIRLGALKERILYTIRKLEKYIAGEIDVIEELEVKRLPLGQKSVGARNKTYHNKWNKMVTPNIL